MKIDGVRIDSRSLCPLLDTRHRTLLDIIDKYAPYFHKLGELVLMEERGRPLPQGGFAKSTRYAMLTEDQCMLLLSTIRANSSIQSAKFLISSSIFTERAQLVVPAIGRE